MARPDVPAVLLVAVVFVLVLALPGVAASEQPAEPSTTRRSPPLLDCGPASPAVTPDESAFRANVLSLLRDIPSVAAAAPGGFVTAHSGRAGRDRAFARALCFGAAANRSSSSSTTACRACLSAAASDATGGCGGSRRAGIWRAVCFLSYADTESLSAREDAFRGWFYAAGPTSTAAAAATTVEDGVCLSDRAGADCGRCIDDAARAAAALRWLVRMWGEEVIVVGYGCCLRVRISVLPMRSESTIFDSRDIRQHLFVLWVLCMVSAELGIVAWLLVMIIFDLRGIPLP